MVAPTLVKITRYDPGPTGDTQTPFVGKAAFKPSLIRHIEGETPPDYVVTDRRFFVTFGEALDANPATPGVAWVYLEPTDYGPYADLWFWEFAFFRPGQADTPCGVGGVFVPTSGSTVDFGDLVQVDPASGPEPSQWSIQLAAEVAARIAGDEDLQDQIDAITAGDVETVAGVSPVAGDVPAAALKTALSLPTDTVGSIANLQTQIDDIEAGDVDSVNGVTGDVIVALVEIGASLFYTLDVSGAGAPPDPGWVAAADALDARIDVLEDTETAVFASTDGSFGLPAPTGVGGEMVVAGDALDTITFDGTDL